MQTLKQLYRFAPSSSRTQPRLSRPPAQRQPTSLAIPRLQSRTMSSSTDNHNQPQSPTTGGTEAPRQLLEPSTNNNNGNVTTLSVDGEGVRLDHLGPLVVNVDGTMSRISNWEKMAQIERDNTLRIIGKRNKQRLEALRAAKVAENSSGEQ